MRSVPRLARRQMAIGGIAALALAGVIAVGVKARGAPPADRPAVLGPKTQLTTTGAVLYPAISPDGKQLAYVTRQCKPSGCGLSIVVQDVGGSTTRTILEGSSAVYGLEWSPDRRNLIYTGTIGPRTGAYLLSALGGEPRFLSGSTATFWAGGDSLLLGPAFRPDSIFYVGVSALDGIPRDSIRIVGPGQALAAISAVPGSSWILTLVVQRPRGLWQVVDRRGQVADRVINDCACGGVGTTDAVWLHREDETPDHAVVRIAIDRTTGKLATRQDTMALGLFTAFSLTSDGGTMVIDQGSYDHGVFTLPLDSALAGRFPEERRIARASNQVIGSLSPDGARVLARRAVPTVRGAVEYQFAVMPYDGGEEKPIGPARSAVRASWSDSVHVAIASRATTGNLEFAEVDVRTGAQRNRLAVPDSGIRDFAALPTGWAWIPQSSDRYIVEEGGRRRVFPKPAWLSGTAHLVADPAHRRLLYTGWSGAGGDTVSLGVLSLDEGTHQAWDTRIGGTGRIALVDGLGALFLVSEGRDSWSLYAVEAAGRVRSLGTVPRPVSSLTLSRDRRRVVANVRDYRADAWMSRVIR